VRAVEILPVAAADLDEIWAYLFNRSPQAADQVINELTSGIQLLAEFPLWFPLHGLSVRKSVAPAYRIFYSVEAERVVVLRIMHGARDLSGLNLAW